MNFIKSPNLEVAIYSLMNYSAYQYCPITYTNSMILMSTFVHRFLILFVYTVQHTQGET